MLYVFIQYAPAPFFFLGATLAILRVQYEFYRLFFHHERAAKAIPLGLLLGALFSLAVYQSGRHTEMPPHFFSMLFSLFLIVIFTYHLASFREIQTTLSDSAMVLMGIAYIPGLLSHLLLLRLITDGPALVLSLLCLTWMSDAGAYYIGRTFGRHKLYPTVSPNKTVEGAIGGLIGSLLAGVLLKPVVFPLFSWGEILTLSLLLGAMAELGDLTESMFKRSGGVKDASTIIPAHGGLFDKFDSVAYTAPVFYYYLVWMKGYSPIPMGY